jgi:hypothetical protein
MSKAKVLLQLLEKTDWVRGLHRPDDPRKALTFKHPKTGKSMRTTSGEEDYWRTAAREKAASEKEYSDYKKKYGYK